MSIWQNPAFQNNLVLAAACELWRFSAPDMMCACGLTPDLWQVDLLQNEAPQVLLLASRQSGKSTTTALLALHTALFPPRGQDSALVLLLSPSQRQSTELFRKVLAYYHMLGEPVKSLSENVLSLDLANGSRIVSLPENEATIRGYSGVSLLVIDEAARVPDVLYRAVRPMLAVSKGRLLALSTPFGRQGWFYDEWEKGPSSWKRYRITADECPRITKEFLDDEKRSMGSSWFTQEYYCSFTEPEGLVYPGFEACIVDHRNVPLSATGPAEGDRAGARRALPSTAGEAARDREHAQASFRYLAGVDFGFNNPSCFLLGALDGDDVLWITAEIYGSRMTDDDFAHRITPFVREFGIEGLYCDSAAAGSIEKFRRSDLPARKAIKDVGRGIRAVAARINTGRLKITRNCQNLIRELGLYRYPTEEERHINGDNPIKEHDHAPDSLRYLICGIDRPTSVPGLGPPPLAETEEHDLEYAPAEQQRFKDLPRREPVVPPKDADRYLWQRGWEEMR
jgi:phage terminase large subunit